MQSYPPAFKENFHMFPDTFNTLLSLVESTLRPKRRSRPDSLSAKEQLAMTLE